jgi:hypothetical protein
MRVSRTVLSLGLPCLLVLLAVGACDDTPDPCRPEVPAGRIQGRVTPDGIPIDGEIIARRAADGRTATAEFVTQVDDRGDFSLDVPEGDYTIRLEVGLYYARYSYAEPEPSYGNIPPDTVRVDLTTSPVVIDFHLGAVTMDLELPGGLDGVDSKVFLHRRGAEHVNFNASYLDEAYAKIENGRLGLRLGAVLPGEYQFEILMGTYQSERFWWPATHERNAAPWYEVAADSVLSLSNEITHEPARIEGRVTGAWQDMGLSPPTVYMVTPDSATTVGIWTLSLSAEFEADLFVPGPFKLGVFQGGDSGQWIGGPGFDDATLFDPQPGETISGIELVQSGLLFRVGAPEPQAGWVRCELYDPVDLRLVSASSIYLGFTRTLSLSNLWPGEFLVRVSPGEGYVGDVAWRPQWFDRAESAAQAQLITISHAGEIVARDLVLELGGVIGGRVEFSEEVSFCYVAVTPADDPLSWAYDSFYTSGSAFRFQGLPDGDFKIGAWAGQWSWDGGPPPEGTIWYPGTTDWSGAGIIEIRDAGVVSGIVIEIP